MAVISFAISIFYPVSVHCGMILIFIELNSVVRWGVTQAVRYYHRGDPMILQIVNVVNQST